jgi:benzoylformate decarboxylase
MRGKQVLMDTLEAHGVEFIFGNPGTTENPFLDALVDRPRLRYILALHEGVATGAAHYYAQASGKTGVVNLHVAPGLGNALGMLYNAFEAGSPLLVTAGQQDTRLRLREPFLSHDLVAMAAPLVKWSVQAERADELALLLHRALKVAHDPPSGPVFVALPLDVLEQETGVGALLPSTLYRLGEPDRAGVEAAAALLLGSRQPVIVVGDGVAQHQAETEARALAELLGAPVWNEGQPHHLGFPSTHGNRKSGLPMDVAALRKVFDGADVVLLVGGNFFKELWFEPGGPFPDDTAVIQIEPSPARLAHNFAVRVGILAGPRQGLAALRERVAARAGDELRAAAAERNRTLARAREGERTAQRARAEARWDQEPIAVPRLMAELGEALPARAVVVNEGITAAVDLTRTLEFARPDEYYGQRSGGIGQALPGALGVKLARPDRAVVAVSGDGSAMYSIQALWTAAHHDLAVVFVIVHNREYRILKHNMDAFRRRFDVSIDRPYLHMDLATPELGFVEMAQGMGVAARRVTRPGELGEALQTAFAAGKPYLLDVVVEGARSAHS